MCRQICVEFLLANHFQKSPQKPLTYTGLRKLRSGLESAIESLVYVDISASSVLWAVEQYPKMFKWDGKAVTRAKESEAFFSADYVESHFNSEVDESIRQAALRVVRSTNVEDSGVSVS